MDNSGWMGSRLTNHGKSAAQQLFDKLTRLNPQLAPLVELIFKRFTAISADGCNESGFVL